jgi:hypothetical protein
VHMRPSSEIGLILFFVGFVFIRIIPVRLYKGVLPENDLLPLALLSSSTLSLVVAVTYLGVRSGDMLPENAHALVGARNSRPQSTNGLSIETKIRNRSLGPPPPKPFSSSTTGPKKFSPKQDANE